MALRSNAAEGAGDGPTVAGGEPRFESRYAELPETCFARVDPTPVEKPALLRLNSGLAESLGFDPEWLAGEAGVALLAGNRVPKTARTLAMAYAGHQFGQWVPSLGDGRAILLGERRDRDGRLREVQLKGAGRTPFSRGGDGRAAIGPVLREYVVSEAMHALGVPTTRALAMVASGEPVYRERAEPGAVLTRVSSAHLRVGTFQYFHQRGDVDTLRALADHAIDALYPEARGAESPELALLAAVVRSQADLVAQWMGLGFIHGVMNTDNCSIAGETLDYGPCAFMDTYHPETVFSSIDRGGRYAFHRQPGIALWNLARFAETLLPLLAGDEEAALQSGREILDTFGPRFQEAYQTRLLEKVGLPGGGEAELETAGSLLKLMAEQGADYTLTFRRLAEAPADDLGAVRTGFAQPLDFDAWALRWRERLAAGGRSDDERRAAMQAANPAFIPRNHRVQQAIEGAERGDLDPLEDLLAVTATPYVGHPQLDAYQQPPEPHEVVRQTFCGT